MYFQWENYTRWSWYEVKQSNKNTILDFDRARPKAKVDKKEQESSCESINVLYGGRELIPVKVEKFH